jgi:hypothetical protein
MEQKKLTQEEIDTVQGLQKQFQDVTYQIGQLEVKKLLLQKDIDQINNEIQLVHSTLISLQQKDKEIAESLTEKYGNGYINIETGEISDYK